MRQICYICCKNQFFFQNHGLQKSIFLNQGCLYNWMVFILEYLTYLYRKYRNFDGNLRVYVNEAAIFVAKIDFFKSRTPVQLDGSYFRIINIFLLKIS